MPTHGKPDTEVQQRPVPEGTGPAPLPHPDRPRPPTPGPVPTTGAGMTATVVPAVAGLDAQTAVDQLSEAGLVVDVRRECAGGHPADTAVRTDPATGSAARRGHRIVVYATPAATLVTVPDLTGVARDAAVGHLRTRMLTPGQIRPAPDPDPGPSGTVSAQEPPAWSRVGPCTAIDLYVRTATVKPSASASANG